MTHRTTPARHGWRTGLVGTLIASFAAPIAAQTAIRVDTLTQVDGGTGGITIDRDGNIYSSDFGAQLGDPSTAGTKIFRVTPDGKTTVFADGIVGASGSGMDAKGNLYQSNLRSGAVSRITPDGKVTTFANDGFQAPVGIEVDPDGTLFVTNCASQSIQRVTQDGTSTRFASSELFKCANGISRASDGNLYVANFADNNVIKVTPDGEASAFATIPGTGNGHLVFAHNALWVVARAAHQIYRVSLAGKVTLVAGSGKKGGQNGAPNEASFCFPNDLGWSPDGKTLYVNEVSDEASSGGTLAPTRIRRITFDP